MKQIMLVIFLLSFSFLFFSAKCTTEDVLVASPISESCIETNNVFDGVNSTISVNMSSVNGDGTEKVLDITTGVVESSVPDINVTHSNNTFKVSCLLNNSNFASVVEIVNSTKLIRLMKAQTNITSSQSPATCVIVLFYSPSCPFSCMAAPHFNALPRVFPDIRMVAVDTSTRYNFNAQYGIVGVPSLLLFHNGRPAARFNNTSDYSLEAFAKFVTKNTGLNPEGKLFVTSVDFAGPISSVPLKQTDYFLILSWIFIIYCMIYFFYYSSLCQWLIDTIRSAWREAEAQHHHAD